MTTYRDPTWGVMTKMLGISALLLVLWWLVPSDVFFRQISMAVVKDEVTGDWFVVSVRDLPFGATTGRTSAVMQVLGRPDALECQLSPTEALYIPQPNNTTRYSIDEWAKDCLDIGPPISVQYKRQVLLGGFIPLRPAYFAFTINPEAAPVVPIDIP